MAPLRVPGDGLLLSGSPGESESFPSQAFAIALSDDVIGDLVRCAQNGDSLELSLGSSPVSSFPTPSPFTVKNAFGDLSISGRGMHDSIVGGPETMGMAYSGRQGRLCLPCHHHLAPPPRCFCPLKLHCFLFNPYTIPMAHSAFAFPNSTFNMGSSSE